MKYIITVLIVFLGHLSFSIPNDSLTVVVVCEFSFKRKVLLVLMDGPAYKLLDFKKNQYYEIKYSIDSINEPLYFELWEKRRLFGFKKREVYLNNYRDGEILIIDRSNEMSKKYPYNWYWVRSLYEIRTPIRFD